jgi:nucleoid-associated protein YgaU
MTTLTTLPQLPMSAPVRRSAAGRRRVVRGAQWQAAGPLSTRPASPRAVRCAHSFEPDLHGSRLTARGRLLVTFGWLVLALAAAVPIMRAGDATTHQQGPSTTVVVEPGGTLWEVARSIDAAADPRELVDAIVELNGLRSGADLRPGDVLVVPVR